MRAAFVFGSATASASLLEQAFQTEEAWFEWPVKPVDGRELDELSRTPRAPVGATDEAAFASIAVRIGSTRLIDNVPLPPDGGAAGADA